MMWWWDGGGWWAWTLMTFGMLAFWAVVAWLVLNAARSSGAGRRPDPEARLAERFADGEIDADEYRSALEVLRGSRRGGQAGHPA